MNVKVFGLFYENISELKSFLDYLIIKDEKKVITYEISVLSVLSTYQLTWGNLKV